MEGRGVGDRSCGAEGTAWCEPRKRKHRMKSIQLLILFTLSYVAFSGAAFGQDILGDYVLVKATPGDDDFDPHTLNAISARITQEGDQYQITVDHIADNDPSTVPLYIDGKKLSFFLPPRKFTRDGRDLVSNAEAYFGEIVQDQYVAGWATNGERRQGFKLKRVKSLPAETAG